LLEAKKQILLNIFLKRYK